MKHVSNQEKARELAHFILYDKSYESMERNTYDKCMQMAEWKDEQEIEFLQSLMFQASTYHIFDKINERIKFLKGE